MKLKILEAFKNSDLYNRFFKAQLFANQNTNIVQFHSGGDDYNPPANCEGLGDTLGNTASNGVVFAWRDEIERTAEAGEKRIYAVSSDNSVVAEIHLKNDGTIMAKGNNLNFEISGNVNITADVVNLGGDGGGLVLTENSTIVDSQGGTCTITPNTSKTKAV